jgi:hypothetical protein
MSNENQRNARLDAIGTVRAILTNDTTGARTLLEQTDDPREMAHAACGFVVALLSTMPPDTRRMLLDELTRAAVHE